MAAFAVAAAAAGLPAVATVSPIDAGATLVAAVVARAAVAVPVQSAATAAVQARP